jgi:hypothetical protein
MRLNDNATGGRVSDSRSIEVVHKILVLERTDLVLDEPARQLRQWSSLFSPQTLCYDDLVFALFI